MSTWLQSCLVILTQAQETEVSIGDNEWLSIEKICDDYIEKKIETDLDPDDEHTHEESEMSSITSHKDVIDL